MLAVPSDSMLNRLTRPMVVGPFRPAMRRASVADSGSDTVSSLEAASETASLEAAALEATELEAAPPQAARPSAMVSASSRETIFFIM